MKPKPILVIGIPHNQGYDIDNVLTEIGKDLKDYHVFVYLSESIKDPVFQCFYEKDFDHVKYEELKAIIHERASAPPLHKQ